RAPSCGNDFRSMPPPATTLSCTDAPTRAERFSDRSCVEPITDCSNTSIHAKEESKKTLVARIIAVRPRGLPHHPVELVDAYPELLADVDLVFHLLVQVVGRLEKVFERLLTRHLARVDHE